MRLLRLLAIALLALATVASVVPAAGAAAPASLDRFIVKFPGDALPSDLRSRLTSLGVTEAVAFESINAAAITAPDAVVRQLVDDGYVVSARAERRLQLHLASSVPYIGADRATLGEKDRFRVRNRRMTRPAVDGTGATVAVLDTGIFDLHPDLAERVVAHRNFELAYAADLLLSGEQLDAFALATGESARTDDIGHGTHVGGIVAGTGFAAQNRRNDNRGVAPGAKLVDLRIAAGPIQGLVGDTGWERNAIAAFDWLARHHDDTTFGVNGIGLSTNSWGLLPEDTVYGAPDYDPLREIIEVLYDEGLVTVFSAGNDGPEDNVTNKTVPNGLPEVVSVAASCKPGAIQEDCDKKASVNDIAAFSSRGPAVDIAAPGVEIVSAVSPSLVGALAKGCPPAELDPDGTLCPLLYRGEYGGENEADVIVNYAMYGSLHGTSMAAPHIAGVVALLKSVNPDLSPWQVAAVLGGSADDRQARGRDIEAGYGLVDVPEALEAAVALKKGVRLRHIFPGFRVRASM